MKKILFTLTIIISATLLYFYNGKTTRNIATSDLTDAQKQKKALIESLTVSYDNNSFKLQTTFLQSLCATENYIIRLIFKAENIAISGEAPQVVSVFSCNLIKENTTLDYLETNLNDFKNLPSLKTLNNLSSSGLVSNEELPDTWSLKEIQFASETSFSINEAELELLNSKIKEPVVIF